MVDNCGTVSAATVYFVSAIILIGECYGDAHRLGMGDQKNIVRLLTAPPSSIRQDMHSKIQTRLRFETTWKAKIKF